jgi:hypothetical protein
VRSIGDKERHRDRVGGIAANGAVTLRGGGAGPTWSYSAHYEGQLVGSRLTLTGGQMWRLPSGEDFNRACIATLDRQG